MTFRLRRPSRADRARQEILDAPDNATAITLSLQWTFGGDSKLLQARRSAIRERLGLDVESDATAATAMVGGGR
jgi:hypothetical protein